MVKRVEDLEQFKDNATHCRILYRTDFISKDVVRVRIRAGSLGWDGQIKDGDKLIELLGWLKYYDAVKVIEEIPDELFFML